AVCTTVDCWAAFCCTSRCAAFRRCQAATSTMLCVARTRASTSSTGPIRLGMPGTPGTDGNGMPSDALLNVRLDASAAPVSEGSRAARDCPTRCCAWSVCSAATWTDGVSPAAMRTASRSESAAGGAPAPTVAAHEAKAKTSRTVRPRLGWASREAEWTMAWRILCTVSVLPGFRSDRAQEELHVLLDDRSGVGPVRIAIVERVLPQRQLD